MDNFAKLIKKADNHRDDNLPIDTNKSGDRLTQTPKEILIIHTWGIGDLILLTPVLRAISHLHPWIKISMLFFPKAAALPILESPYVHEVLFTKWNLSTLLSTLIKLRRKKYHAVMFSSGVTHWKAWLFMLLLRAESRIGEYSIARLPGLTAYIRFNPSVSRTQANYSLFKAVLELPAWKEALELKDTLELTPYFHLAPENIAWAQQWLIDKNLTKQLIGIHPGCMAKNKYRRWNKDYFVELITLLIHAINCDVVVIAGPDELDVGSYISQKTSTRLITGAALSNVAAVIAKCSFFINTDSSLGHVASCFGVKSLTIFGPGDENQTAPFSENSHVIRHSIACAPCIGKKRKVCEVECLTRLKPITVFNEAMRLFPK